MSYEIKVDKGKCIGCGSCEAICPKIFTLKDGKAIAKKAMVDKIDCEEEAKDSCPVGAISIAKK
jgi:ferredoxin